SDERRRVQVDRDAARGAGVAARRTRRKSRPRSCGAAAQHRRRRHPLGRRRRHRRTLRDDDAVMLRRLSIVLLWVAAGCGHSSGEASLQDAGDASIAAMDANATHDDAGVVSIDARVIVDAGFAPDAEVDAGTEVDAGPIDPWTAFAAQ